MNTQGLEFDLRPRSSRRPEWRRAMRYLRELVRYPERTGLAFRIQVALDPDMHERALRGMLAHPEGRRVFAKRPSLLASLANRDLLAGMPSGSFGRAYLEHIDRHGLDPTKLVSLGRAHETDAERDDPDIQWMAERGRLAHDLWHVLTGYAADEVGETALLLFSHGHAGGKSNALLSLGAGLKIVHQRGVGWIRYGWQAWRRGRRAIPLSTLPYERLLPLPLDDVRVAARIDPLHTAHPGSVRCNEVHSEPRSLN